MTKKIDDQLPLGPTLNSIASRRAHSAIPSYRRLSSTTISPIQRTNDDSLLDPTPSQRPLLAGVSSRSLQLGLFLLLTLLEGLVVFVELDLFLLGRLEGFELWVKKSGLRGEQSSSVQGDGGW
jgi:hypothetical protein